MQRSRGKAFQPLGTAGVEALRWKHMGMFGDRKTRCLEHKEYRGGGRRWSQRRQYVPSYAGPYRLWLGVGIVLFAVGSLWGIIPLNMGMMSSELRFTETTLAALQESRGRETRKLVLKIRREVVEAQT